MKNEIECTRNAINALDNDLITLLQKRAALAIRMGALKQADGTPTLDPSRESAIIDRLSKLIQPPLTRDMLTALFHVIFSISRSLQAKQRIAYLGPEGSYTHAATTLIFPCDATLLPQPSFEAVIQELLAGRADLGIAPVENSIEGMVSQTLDLVASSRLAVVREIQLPIKHCLLSKTNLTNISRVFSHPQALAQCRGWIKVNLPGAATIATASTSDAALTAASEPESAAIASVHASKLYGVPILAENISDVPDNITRFWVLSRTMVAPPTHAKTSLILTLENKPGSLFHTLGAFAEQGINLTKIESRPSRKDHWEYLFFIDFQGSLADEKVQKAMEIIKQHTREIIVLGSYPEVRIGE
jgi:chorismate mutase / prephenate dehydratase